MTFGSLTYLFHLEFKQELCDTEEKFLSTFSEKQFRIKISQSYYLPFAIIELPLFGNPYHER